MARQLSSTVLSLVCVLCLSAVRCQRYVVPEASLEFLHPRGLKISIPDTDEGATLVAFHINLNEEFTSLAHGHWAQDIIKRKGGRWTYTVPDLRAKQGDTIYYWVYVIVDNLGYHGLDRSYKVTQADPHKSKGSTSNPTQPPTYRPPSTLRPPPTTSPDRDIERPCQPSQSSHHGGVSACTGQVLLDKRFGNLKGWRHEVHIGGSQPDDEFTVFTKDMAVSSAKNKNLVIKPILLGEKYNDTMVTNGNLQLLGCTSSVEDQCVRRAVSYLILPPVMSARLTTKDSFSFRYGIVELRAWLPRGDWIVPELWLEPKTPSYGEQSGRIVLGLSRGNADSSGELESGVVIGNCTQLVKRTQDKPWSQGYHNFKLTWTPDELLFSVDGEDIARLPSGNSALEPSLNAGKLAPFDKEFYITLGVHVAGGQDFPDGIPNKPWKNSEPKRFLKFWQAKNEWRSTWNQDSALRVESVKVTAL